MTQLMELVSYLVHNGQIYEFNNVPISFLYLFSLLDYYFYS
jgi:hypothetical protein